MKLGIEIRVDVKKIMKERLYAGQKGTYLTMTTFIDTENPSQYGDHGIISQKITKEEKDQGIKLPILGNCKIFYGLPQAGNQNQGYQNQNKPVNSVQKSHGNQYGPDDNVPF